MIIFLQSWLSAVVCSCPVWLIQTRQWWMCRERTGLLLCRIVLATPEAGATHWAGAGSTSSAKPFSLIVSIFKIHLRTQKPDGCYSRRRAVQYGEGGQCWRAHPEIHYHLHSFLERSVPGCSDHTGSPDKADDTCIICKLQEFNRLLRHSCWCREKSSGESTHCWGLPVLMLWVQDVISPCLATCCPRSVEMVVIHWQVGAVTVSWVSLVWWMSGMVVLSGVAE